MKSKILHLKSKNLRDDSDLIYVTENNSHVEFESAVNILKVSFNIEIITVVMNSFDLKIQLSKELPPQNFFITKIKFDKNKKEHSITMEEIIEKSINFKQYSDIDIQFVSLETDSEIDIDLKLNFL